MKETFMGDVESSFKSLSAQALLDFDRCTGFFKLGL